MSKLERMVIFRKILGHFINIYNYVWLFFEIHAQRFIFIAFVLLCVSDVSIFISYPLA